MFRGNRSPSLSQVFPLALISCLLCVLFAAGVQAAALWSSLDPDETRRPVPLMNDTVGKLVEKLKPAVVNISVTQVVKAGGTSQGFGSPFGEDDPFREFWKRFFGNQEPREFKRKGLGSGIIINKEGYIITNNHVIQNAKDVAVILSNKEQFPARVLGSDPKTDIALIKIEAKKELPFAPLGDSDRLQEGETVIAIGNPFGLSETVTTGIVSAKGRAIGAGPYDDFIQTDASINPGNSGGPLINYHGEVMGINTAISATGQGIGFAVPINMAKEILMQLKERGKVTRGWLGVSIQEITPEIAESFGLKNERGALVSDVVPGGPADRAGLQRGDIITEFNGRAVREYNELPRLVASIPPGEKATFRIMRNGKEEMISAVVEELHEEATAAPSEEVQKQLGISLQQVTPELARELGLKKPVGVVVTNVEPDSTGSGVGIQRGDVILEADRKAVNSVSNFNEIVSKAQRSILLLLYRNGATFYVSVKLSRE